ncbi:hypothetical protein J8J14_12990 [Roseomonas sp. SSH11]|uniref:TerB family tellurite resistance protein n=1 Tax=Pararoseomonas baculiformis TaxID=2820812 RepID=A0ABS4AHJ4_9PROT|nr:hypothetical protein [Pararoseomonas baculiformis]MBP0445689.1 hypothetical protein [Pararoseomonas baculiformis]
MSRDFLDERRRALEEAFFARHNEELIRKLRAADPGRPERERLADASGLQDAALLDRLVGLGIRGETLAALTLVPLVVVAWCDGTLGEKERAAILEAAHHAGLDGTGPGRELLAAWLAKAPPPGLLGAWTDYVHALSPEARATLRRQVMDRATQVAEAAGGMLGLLNGISPAERRTLQQLEAAFAT